MKNSIRKQILEKRIQYEYAQQDSEKIIERILPFIQDAQNILLFYPHKNEVNLLPLISILQKKGVNVYLPKTSSQDIHPILVESLKNLKKGKFGIPEPEGKEASYEDIDVVIVPAVAFDKKGHRIGYGKGYYDRFLKNFKGLKIGVAYDFQIVDKIPYEAHDIPVDIIVTPTKIIKTKEEKND